MDPWGDPNLPRPHPHLPGNDVGRMYIEYCPGGDLEQMHEKNPPGRQWAEEEIWRLLECLARGAVVMDSGTENLQIPANIWAQPVFPPGYDPAEIDPRRPICHFDLKPANSTLTILQVVLLWLTVVVVLIAARDPNAGAAHNRLPGFKVRLM